MWVASLNRPVRDERAPSGACARKHQYGRQIFRIGQKNRDEVIHPCGGAPLGSTLLRRVSARRRARPSGGVAPGHSAGSWACSLL